jgi:hypothetical protein
MPDDHSNDSHGHDDHPKNHPVTIQVNRRDVIVPDDDVTGSQIKGAAQVPDTFKLFDPKGNEVANDTTIHVHANERFTAISGQDVS